MDRSPPVGEPDAVILGHSHQNSPCCRHLNSKHSKFGIDRNLLTGSNGDVENLLTAMTKPVGGRGIRAPYETTHIRVPIPIKPEVERLIERYRIGENTDDINPITGLESASVIAKNILGQKKSARVSLSKLLTAIYGQNVRL